MMTPEQILAALRRDSRTHITSMWRWMSDTSGVASGSAITNYTLNEFEPYYAGWAKALEFTETIIHPNSIEQLKNYLDKEPWGTKRLGGCIYRLKSGFDTRETTGGRHAV